MGALEKHGAFGKLRLQVRFLYSRPFNDQKSVDSLWPNTLTRSDKALDGEDWWRSEETGSVRHRHITTQCSLLIVMCLVTLSIIH